jgi:hypothetical protein
LGQLEGAELREDVVLHNATILRLLPFGLLLTLYASTVARTVGPGDSGELTAVMTSAGVAHAPGYPLLTLLGWLVSRVPWPGEPAAALNFLSSIAAAGACAFVGRAVARLTHCERAAFIAPLVLGCSRVFWEYALVVEVFALNAFFAAVLLYLVARFCEALDRGAREMRCLPFAAAAMAAVVTHHQTLAIVAIPCLVVLVAQVPRLRALGVRSRELWRWTALSVAAGLAALAPLLYLPIAAAQGPVLNWDDPRDLEGFLRLLLRRDFGTSSLVSDGIVGQKVLEEGAGVAPSPLRHNALFFLELPRSFGYAALVPLAAGVWSCLRRRRLAALCGMIGILHVLFFTRVNAPVTPLFMGVVERFYILSHVAAALVAGLGGAVLIRWSERSGFRGSLRGWVVAAVLVALCALWPAAMNARLVDRRTNTFTRDLGRAYLAALPEHALVIAQGDMLHNALHYSQLSMGERRDVTYLDVQKLTYAWHVRDLRRHGALEIPATFTHGAMDVPERSLRALVSANGRERAIFMPAAYDKLLLETHRLAPMGLWRRVYAIGAPPDIDARARECERLAELLDERSAAREYGERSWERDTRIVYFEALMHAAATCDFADARRAAPQGLETSARARRFLERASALPGATEALVWARRASGLWNLSAEYGLTRSPSGFMAAMVERVRAFAEAAIAADARTPDGHLALIDVLMLVEPQPESAMRREIHCRQAILDRRGGDLVLLDAYLRLVSRVIEVSQRDESGLIRDAISRQREVVRRLEAAVLVSSEPVFAKQLALRRESLATSERSLEAYRAKLLRRAAPPALR